MPTIVPVGCYSSAGATPACHCLHGADCRILVLPVCFRQVLACCQPEARKRDWKKKDDVLLDVDAVLADAPKQHLTSSTRHFEKVLAAMSGTSEVARNAVHSRIESLKQELYSRDPTHVQVAKLQSAIDRAQTTHAQKEQAAEAARNISTSCVGALHSSPIKCAKNLQTRKTKGQ